MPRYTRFAVRYRPEDRVTQICASNDRAITALECQYLPRFIGCCD